MAADKDPSSMPEPGYPVHCYPVAPPPRGEDLPYSDGVPMESERHLKQMLLLTTSLEFGWAHRHDFYVAGNMFVYFSELQSKKNDFRGPDVFVVLDTVRKERKSWVVWEEDGRTPDVVIEITSPSSEQEDRGRKKDLYARVLHVREYFLYDPFEKRLEGYSLDAEHWEYRPKMADARGWLRSEQLGLWLGPVHSTFMGLEAELLRWIDDDGRVLPSSEEAALAAKVLLDESSQRAEQEAKRAEQEAKRAEQEAKRAEQEAQRADRAAQRLRKAADRLIAAGVPEQEVEAALGVDLKRR